MGHITKDCRIIIQNLILNLIQVTVNRYAIFDVVSYTEKYCKEKRQSKAEGCNIYKKK